ncbi:MAG: cupin domain-containing protein [Pseudomonadota bacterium]
MEGALELTIGGVTKTYHPGDSYDIPAGVEHSAKVKAGARVVDAFEEADRYPLKP